MYIITSSATYYNADEVILYMMENTVKSVITSYKAQLEEAKITPPEKKVGGEKYLFSEVKNWDDIILLAAAINSECRNCNNNEKEVIGQVINNRVRDNFNNYGSTYYAQITAKSQFSGVKRGKYVGKYFFYDGYVSIINKRNKEKKSFKDRGELLSYLSENNLNIKDYYVRKDEVSLACYKIAYKIIVQGYQVIPDNVYYFCNSAIATNKKEVARQKKYKADLSKWYDVSEFKHDIFAKGTP